MRHVVGCAIFIILLLVSPVHMAQGYEEFVRRWPLNRSLKCISREVNDLGPDPRPRPGDPSYGGFRTACFFLQEGAHLVHIDKWPVNEELLAVVFVQGKPPFTPVFKEGQRIQECQTLSDMESSSQPQWINSKDKREIQRKLRSHCFFKRIEEKAKFKYVFKVTYNPPRGRDPGYFESKRILFLIPNEKNYYIANNEEEVDRICTRCVAGGGFSQTPLVKGNNITALLNDASQKHFG